MVSPTHVGMNRRSQINEHERGGKPHARGDEPVISDVLDGFDV